MSKISYCSLEEAWGSSYNKTNDNNVKDTNNSSTTNSSTTNSSTTNSMNNNNLKENNNKIQIRNDEKYNLLYKKSEEDYNNVISNMNNIERHNNNNNSEKSIVEYNKYRINSSNQVAQNHIENDHSLQKYMPFSESIERKYLEDKLKFLENEILKYKHLFEKDDYDDSSNYNKNNYIESFSNQNTSNNQSKTNDIIDIILLIIIGLIIILVMNSIFNIGKAIGVRNK